MSRASRFETRPDLPVQVLVGSSRRAKASQAVVMLGRVPDTVNQLLATEAALNKLGARGIHVVEAEQMIWNRHVVVRNRRGSPERGQPDVRRLVIGESDANRVLTLVIEETIEPTTWLLVTGWDSTPAERKILERS